MSPVEAIGKYYDGQSAKPREVMIGHHSWGLRIESVEGNFKKDWYYKDIRLVQIGQSPQPAILGHADEIDSRLYINPDGGWLRIRDSLPPEMFSKKPLPVTCMALIGYAGFAIASIALLFALAPRLLEYGAYIIPHSWEKQLGSYVINQISHNEYCTTPDGDRALKIIKDRLGGAVDRNINLSIRVVPEPDTLNAFAAPGGYIGIFSAVLEQAESPEEVAGVLAHEIAHIELDHPMRGLMREAGVKIILSMIFGDSNLGANAAGLAGLVNEMRYSRADESEADARARQIMQRAELDPQALNTFFLRLQEQEEKQQEKSKLGSLPDYLSSHPTSEARIEAGQIDHDFVIRPLLSADEWQALRNICAP